MTGRIATTLSAALLAVLLIDSAAAQGVFEKRVSPVSPTETKLFQKQVKVALIVGVSKYPAGSGFDSLNFAAADASDLAATLKLQGYLVRVLTDSDATRGSIENTLNDLSGNIDPEQGTFLFYFSGHGFAVQGKNYLAPFSVSKSNLERDGLAVEDVVQLLAKSNAKRQLMLLDACRSDESTGAKGAGSRSFSAFQSSQGLRILNSTKIGRVSYESGELRHGVFTAFLLQGLQGAAAGADGLVTFHDLADYVTESVRRWSNDHGKVQVPFEAVGTTEASGDFLLAGKMPAGALPPPPPVPQQSDQPAAVSPSDQLLYTAALRTGDPDQMEAAAAKISNSILASSLRTWAASRRSTATQTSQPPPTEPTVSSDLELYRTALNSGDPAQMEAAAGKISNQTLAAALRSRASLLKNRAAAPASGSPTAGMSPTKAHFYSTNNRTQANLYAKRGNYMQALPLYQQAAEAGDSQSMVNVGMIYRDALGTTQNYPEALKWFQKAADLGEPQAMAYLGMMYSFGEGVPKNDALAFQWDQKAAGSGNSMGMLGLGVCYQMGRGTAKNLTEAASWYRKAAALGDPTAKKLLQDMGQR